MAITLQTILDNTNDVLGNYTTSTIDPGQKIRAINRTIEYIKRRLGLPSDETIQTINFCEDQYFYTLNIDFDEAFHLLYHDPLLNTEQRRWDWMPYEDILQRTGDGNTSFKWSVTTINGENQLVTLGQNLVRSTLIESFDSVGDWTVSGDGSALVRDALEKYKGDASLAFTSTYSAGSITLQDATLNLDVQTFFEKHGIFKVRTRLPTTNITNIKLVLYVDDSNYWTITETDQDDGTAFTANEWIKIGFPLDNVVETGTPEIDETVTKMQIVYTTTSGFTGTVRVDDMFVAIPDSMDLIYYTRYKGTSSGGTNKIHLTTASDLLRIGDYFDDYIELISQGAALRCLPSLRGDKEFFGVFKADFEDMIRVLGKRFPRKRVQGSFSHHLRR